MRPLILFQHHQQSCQDLLHVSFVWQPTTKRSYWKFHRPTKIFQRVIAWVWNLGTMRGTTRCSCCWQRHRHCVWDFGSHLVTNFISWLPRWTLHVLKHRAVCLAFGKSRRTDRTATAPELVPRIWESSLPSHTPPTHLLSLGLGFRYLTH